MYKHMCSFLPVVKYTEMNSILSLAKFQSLHDHFHLWTEVNKNHLLQRNRLGVQFCISKIFNSTHTAILSIVIIVITASIVIHHSR